MKYIVWCPDLGQTREDGKVFEAADAEAAAVAWAEWNDRESAEYDIVSGTPATVKVGLALGFESPATFTVYWAADPEYWAVPV